VRGVCVRGVCVVCVCVRVCVVWSKQEPLTPKYVGVI